MAEAAAFAGFAAWSPGEPGWRPHRMLVTKLETPDGEQVIMDLEFERAGSADRVRVSIMSPEPPFNIARAAQPVDIQGVSGAFASDARFAIVTWRRDGKTFVAEAFLSDAFTPDVFFRAVRSLEEA